MLRQIITPEGELVSRQCVPGKQCPCVFEYIYLARPDSVLDDIPVYNFQLGLGTRLARRIRDKVRPSTLCRVPACAWRYASATRCMSVPERCFQQFRVSAVC